MRVELHINGFEKTDSVETFLNTAAQDLANDYLRNEGDVHIRIHVHEDRARNQNRKPHFFCEVQLKTGASKNYYKAHKADEDFKTAVNEAMHAMKRILQKRSDRRHDDKVEDITSYNLNGLNEAEETVEASDEVRS